MKDVFLTFRSAVLAGICIGIAGFGFLAMKGIWHDIPGAVFFAFGLATVVHYGFKLYTGAVGFAWGRKGLCDLGIILLGNLLGCLLVALIARVSPLGLCEKATAVLNARLADYVTPDGTVVPGILKSGILAIGCGFIMTSAVTFGRQDKFLPLIFGVPLFILCGFPHCIADAFYYWAVPFGTLFGHGWSLLWLYLAIVLGNSIGGNLFRLLMWRK